MTSDSDHLRIICGSFDFSKSLIFKVIFLKLTLNRSFRIKLNGGFEASGWGPSHATHRAQTVQRAGNCIGPQAGLVGLMSPLLVLGYADILVLSSFFLSVPSIMGLPLFPKAY